MIDGTKRDERQLQIRSLLVKHDYLTVLDLCKELGCSEATMRNDLREMEQKGLVKRVYGGAMSTGNTAYNAGLNLRSNAFQDEKQAICRYAIKQLIIPGQIIIIDAGSTCAELARQIAELPFQLTVLTNSLPVAYTISQSSRHLLHLAGGFYDHACSSFHDSETMNFLNNVHADLFFLSPNGISTEIGLAVPDHSEAAVKTLMMHKAGRVIALADHSKINKIGFRVVCGLSDVELIITDEKADLDEIKKIKQAGGNIVTASDTPKS